MNCYKDFLRISVLLGTVLFVLVGFLGTGALAQESNQPQTERLREITGLRTANSKTFELSDGKKEWVGYGEAVHFKDSRGKFQEIDDSLVAEKVTTEDGTYVFRNGVNAFDVYFGESTSEPILVAMQYKGASVSFGLAGIKIAGSKDEDAMVAASRTSVAEKTKTTRSKQLTGATYGENLISYSNVYPGIDLYYELKTYGIREYFVLRGPTDENEFIFDLSLKGVAPKEEKGQITFVDEKGEALFYMGDLVAIDEAGVDSRDIDFKLLEAENGYKLIISVSTDYLSDPTRIYPIIVDPNLMITGDAKTFDTFVSSKNPNTTYTYATTLRTGNDGLMGSLRTLLRFELPTNINSNMVTKAYIRIEKSSGLNPATVRAYRNTASWSSGTATWNNKPAYDSSASVSSSRDGSTNWWLWDDTQVVKKWLAGTYGKYGWTVRDTNENANNYTYFYACDAPSPHKPELHITYNANVTVNVKIPCDKVYRDARTAVGQNWSTVAQNALTTASEKFTSEFGIVLKPASTVAWSSPLDGCASKPFCTASHLHYAPYGYKHVNPEFMMTEAQRVLGFGSNSLMVSVTGAAPMIVHTDAVMFPYDGYAYDYASNKAIATSYSSSPITLGVKMRHEISHLYGSKSGTNMILDHGYVSTKCVMTYGKNSAGQTTIPYPDVWCSSCKAKINATRTLH